MSRPIEEIVADALHLREAEPLAISPMPGGANSEVFRVDADDGRSYLAKRYARRPGDESDRLETEFGALSFLWDRGLRSVPEPVSAHPAEGVGLYGYIAGRHVAPAEVDRRALDEAAAFLSRVHSLRNDPAARLQPIAKEASFSLSAHLAVVDGRLARLESVAPDSTAAENLRLFIDQAFRPALEATRARLIGTVGGPEALGRELPREMWSLSPSDFGFHNILRRADHSLAFIDFEYWGWDDPAKLVADFFNQPQVPVPTGLRRHFIDRLTDVYGRECLAGRLPLVWPVISLKWCLIMLNPFTRHHPVDPATLRRQLDKARQHLDGLAAGDVS